MAVMGCGVVVGGAGLAECAAAVAAGGGGAAAGAEGGARGAAAALEPPQRGLSLCRQSSVESLAERAGGDGAAARTAGGSKKSRLLLRSSLDAQRDAKLARLEDRRGGGPRGARGSCSPCDSASLIECAEPSPPSSLASCDALSRRASVAVTAGADEAPRIRIKGPSLSAAMVREWAHMLEAEEPEAAVDLAVHMFNRTTAAAADVQASDPPARRGLKERVREYGHLSLAACMWLALKIDGRQVEVPSCAYVGEVAGFSVKRLTTAEADIAALLGWDFLGGWRERDRCL